MMEAIEVILENCLEALRQGESLETCLGRYPKQAEALRPLLQTALLLEQAPRPALSPAGRQRGLERMHQAMAERERKAAISVSAPTVSAAPLQAWWHRLRSTFYWRTSFALAALALIVVVIGGGASVAVSAASLPGDTFYPIKRVVEQARVTFAIGAEAREQVLWEINQERLREIERLESLGRSETVHFEGILETLQDDHWTVAGQVVVITAETIISGEPAAGHLVSVWGTLQADGQIKATRVTIAQAPPVPANLQGQIEQIADGRWIVSGHVVWVGRETALEGQPSVGWTVSIQGFLLADGSLRATRIAALRPPPQPTATGTPAAPTGGTQSQFVGGGSDHQQTSTSTAEPSHPEETPQATATVRGPFPTMPPPPKMTKTVPLTYTPIPRKTPDIVLTASPTEGHPAATPVRSATARPHPTQPPEPTMMPEPTTWPQPPEP
ncbi:MAG: hypothetical protein GXP41_12280, partial [Chloroflexi bacterium]|nr:hypothetical protein [Chloroflexota bacterium]